MTETPQPSIYIQVPTDTNRPHYLGPADLWDSLRRSIPKLAEGMIDVVISPAYPPHNVDMILDDYLMFDEDIAQDLGVVLVNKTRFSRISDIAIDEIKDTKVAILSKVVEWLISEMQQRAEKMEVSDMARSRDDEGVPFERSVLRREYLEMKYRLESLEK